MQKIKKFLTKHKSISLYVFFIFISILLLIITSNDPFTEIKGVGIDVLSPVQELCTNIGSWFSETINSIGKLQQTKLELEKTRAKLLEYERISEDIIRIKQENLQLKELLDFSRQIDFEYIPAEVIAKQPGNTFSLFKLNKGRKDGVSKDMAVVAQNEGLTGLVGKIIDVGDNYCTVIPIFNSSCYVAARLEISRNDGLVNGLGENNQFILMTNVTKDAIEEIQAGDKIITSGLGELFPKNIYIGYVENIISETYNSSLEIYIRPIIDFSKLEYVLIIDTE
jgi:rod shape-determining protein MreC